MTQGKNKFRLRSVTRADWERMYWTEEKSQWQIAREFGVTQGAVMYWMRKHGIQSRSHDHSLLLVGKRKRWLRQNNPRWQGGRYMTASGYLSIRMPYHPLADNRGYVREHRFIWYEANGPIPKGWHIHHRNGDKLDNRLENLELMTSTKHRALIPDLLRRIFALEEEIRRLKGE